MPLTSLPWRCLKTLQNEFYLSFILLVLLSPSMTDQDEEERVQTRRGQCDLGSTNEKRKCHSLRLTLYGRHGDLRMSHHGRYEL